MDNTLYDIIPGYREAVENESRLRDAAFLNLPELIADIRVKALTPKHLLLLTLRKSPLVVGGDISVDDLLLFVWVVSEDFDPKDEEKRKAIVSKCLETSPENLMKECADYLNLAFYDSNTGVSPSSKDSTHKSNAIYVSNVSLLVDLFASEYGWTPDIVLNLSYKQIWQLVRSIHMRHDNKVIMFNQSDNVKSQWLAQLNRQENNG